MLLLALLPTVGAGNTAKLVLFEKSCHIALRLLLTVNCINGHLLHAVLGVLLCCNGLVFSRDRFFGVVLLL